MQDWLLVGLFSGVISAALILFLGAPAMFIGPGLVWGTVTSIVWRKNFHNYLPWIGVSVLSYFAAVIAAAIIIGPLFNPNPTITPFSVILGGGLGSLIMILSLNGLLFRFSLNLISSLILVIIGTLSSLFFLIKVPLPPLHFSDDLIFFSSYAAVFLWQVVMSLAVGTALDLKQKKKA